MNKQQLVERVLDAVGQHYGFMAGKESGREALAQRLLALVNDYELPNGPPQSKNVTILLSDIRGFTAITETFSARTVMDMLNRYLGRMTEIIVRYGGTIDKFMGDSIMVLFGAPKSKSDDVQRAIACAVEMQQAMNEINSQNESMGLPELYIGIGLNSGTVMAGELGTEVHREYTVIGDEVNLVSRIEAQSLRGQVLLSENTYRLAADYVQVGPSNTVMVKGKKTPVTVYELLSIDRPTMMQVPRRDGRKSPRVQVSMPVFFQCIEGKKVNSRVHEGEVLDISYNGMQVLLPIRLKLGSEIRISLSLHLLGGDCTDMYARILTLSPEEKGFRAGMEFTFVDAAGQRAIKQFVDSMVYQA